MVRRHTRARATAGSCALPLGGLPRALALGAMVRCHPDPADVVIYPMRTAQRSDPAGMAALPVGDPMRATRGLLVRLMMMWREEPPPAARLRVEMLEEPPPGSVMQKFT